MPWDVKEIFRRYFARESLSDKQRIKCLEEDVEDLQRRVKALEDENEECTPISELRASDMVMAYNEKFGWVKACVMETYGKLAFVVGDGKFWFADKVRKIEK